MFSSPDGNEPLHDDVVRQMERILASPLFLASRRLTAFLRYSVERALAGRTEELKEYVVGMEVFGRRPSYNPQEDPVVRIMAGRLRGKLAEYYQGPGGGDPVLIELPRGGYAARARMRLRAAAPPRPVPGSRRAVGRDPERNALHAAFEAAAGGAGRMLTVSGEAGIGKTTLVEEFLEEIAAREAAWILHGRGSERLADTEAFVPIFEGLEGLCRRAPGAEKPMQSAAPAWYAQLARAPAEAGGGGAVSHERMRREFVHFFEELSQSRPVVFFLDDMHWADASTCDLLAYLGSRMERIGLLIVAAYRPAAVHGGGHPFPPLKVDLERRGVSRDLRLPFLGPRDIAAYIDGQFPENLFPAEFAAAVHERTEGNPLFMTDLLRFLREREVLAEQGGVWRMTQAVEELRRAIPSGVQDMIRLQIEQFKEMDRRILLCAAVQGGTFDSAVVARVLQHDPVEVEERLREISGHHFICPAGEAEFADETPSERYRFVHVFYQNVLFGSMTPSRRVSESLAVARVVEGLGGGTPGAAADLALLFEAGRDYAGAARYFLEAARHAARVFAYPEAAAMCERGLAALKALPDSRERDAQELVFVLTLGMSLMATRGYAAQEVEKTYRRARELCLALDEKRRLFPVLWALHTCEVIAGHLPRALEVASEMRRLAEGSRDAAAMAESLHALGTTLAFMGRWEEAREALERIFAEGIPGPRGARNSLFMLDTGVTSMSMWARLLAFTGRLDQAAAKACTSVEMANRLEHPHSLAYATLWTGCIHHLRGEFEEACGKLGTAMALSREHGLHQILEWGRVMRGSSLTHTGRTAEGLAEMRKSLDRQNSMRSFIERSYCLTLLAEALGRNGECREGLMLCEEALEIVWRNEARCYEPETHRVRGELLFALGDRSRLDEVESEFGMALRLAREAGSHTLELRAAVSCFTFRAVWGRPALEETVNKFREGLDSPIVREARRLLDAAQ